MICSDNEVLNATCGIVINGEYILWTAWKQGDLYKTYLNDYHMEGVGSPAIKGHCGGAFSCMIKDGKKIYLIGLFNSYEIMEYDVETDQIRMIYQYIVDKVLILQAFLVEGKIYLFPDSLKSKICIYSLSENRADYIAWEDIITEKKYALIDNVMYFMDIDYLEKAIYGVLYNTPYIIKIGLAPISCKVCMLDEWNKAVSMRIYNGKKYIMLSEQKKVICEGNIEKGKESKEQGNVRVREVDGPIPYLTLTVTDDTIFLIPYSIENEICVIDKKSGEQKELPYPPEFCRIEEGRLFWLPITYEKKIYLLPHCGNGLLVIDMCSYEIKFVKWDTRFDVFFRELIKVQNGRKQEKNMRECIGGTIYSNMKKFDAHG